MTLLRWEPRRDLEQAQRRVRTFFDDFESAIQNGIHMEMGSYSPRVDISEDAQNVYVISEMPGLVEDDVKVTITDGVLTLRGEKKRKEEHSGRNFFRIERTYGEFVRQFALPDNLNEEAVQATFEGGVLEITIPKREPEKPREREVKIGRKA